MAEQKVKLTELPTATDTVDTAQLLINQNSTDQKLAVTHFLRAKNNLSELTNVSQARANLDVPSVDEVNDKLTGFIDGANTFLAGASLSSRSDFIWDEESKSWYYWKGALPKDVPAASNPASTGGVGDNAWGEVGSDYLRDILLSNSGASLIGTSNGDTVQEKFDQLTDGTFNLKYRNYTVYNRLDEELSVASIAGVDPTGVADSTAALNGFFSLLNTNGTKTTIRIPAGTYLTTGLTINNTSLVIKGAGEYPYGASTTKIKAGAANTTLMTFTRSGCRIEGLLFEGFEAEVNFGATETCTGVKFQPSTGTLADIDSTIHGCIFFCLKYGVVGYGRNLTQRLNGYSHVAFPITLNYVPGQQFRGHVIDDNRFHSCGGLGSATDASLADSVCIKLVTNTTQGVLADNYAGDISIKNNKCDNGCFQFFLGHFGRGSIMSCNDIFRCGGSSSVMMKIDNTATSSNTDYDNFVLIGNTIASDAASTNPQSFPDYALWMTGVRGGVVSGNAFGKLYKHGIVIENCADIVLNAIQLKNPSMSVAFGNSAYNAVEIISGGNNIQILGLNVRNSLSSTQIQFVINNASATNVMVDNIQANGYISMINEGSSARTHGIINFGGNRRKEVFATTVAGIPSTINYSVGDICWFTTPPASGAAYAGAICVTAGNGAAAVWRNFGAFA
ncbi:glycosyl hydrolase family 28-related protein [Enterobacter hormaechei]|uniref:tail fiber/spike domain-containing protein n=1 Tax=Enterobacter hormaechei TaxID=158836 RepID=UPI0031D4AE7C